MFAPPLPEVEPCKRCLRPQAALGCIIYLTGACPALSCLPPTRAHTLACSAEHVDRKHNSPLLWCFSSSV